MKRASFLVTAGVLGSLLVLPAPGLLAASASTATPADAAGPAGSAATASAVTGYTVTKDHATRLSQSAGGVSALKAETPATSPFLSALRGAPTTDSGASAGSSSASPETRAVARAAANSSLRATSAARAPHAKAASAAPAGVSHAFSGVNDKESQALINSPITPPDQGLCVGTDTTLSGSPDAVWEPVNEAAQETAKTGTKLRPDVSLGTLFQDPYFIGDVRCVYDQPTKTFFFTEIGYPLASGPSKTGNNTVADVAVVNSRGVAEYQFDTSLNGKCFGDQPKTGFDSDSLIISNDEYCGPKETKYEGAAVDVISKAQLAAEAGTVNDDEIGPIAIAGNPVTGLDPSDNTAGGSEYFVDSTSFLGTADAPAPSASTLDLTTLSNTASVTTGRGAPSLASVTLPSEQYVYPVPAASTGDGSTTTLSDGTVVTSEAAIQPDDDRTSGPVNAVPDPRGGLDLWTSVDTALTPQGDTATRDGSAWFEVSTAQRKVVNQGYTAVKGANLVYPAVDALPNGTAAQTFTLTSPSVSPSIAYNDPVTGGPVTTVAPGAGPHVSFADTDGGSRWGDYSMAVPDPDGSGIWLATEYIPPAADQDPYDNWGTYVFEVPSR